MNRGMRVFVAVVVLAAAARVAARSRPDTTPLVGAQPGPTSTVVGLPTNSPSPTPLPPEACGIEIGAPKIEPRVLGPGQTASVRFSARYDLGPHDLRDRVVLVVGPIGDDVAGPVTAGLARLVDTIGLDQGVQLGYVPVGDDAPRVTWWTGAAGRQEARDALARLPAGVGTVGQWRAAVEVAADALLAGPARLSTALYVVSDGRPPDDGSDLDWRPVGGRLRDGLVQRTFVDLASDRWLGPLAEDDPRAVHVPGSRARSAVSVSNIVAFGLNRVLGLEIASWGYRVELAADRWRWLDISLPLRGAATGMHQIVGGDALIDTWAGTVSLAYDVAPSDQMRSGSPGVVPFTEGVHTFTVLNPKGKFCLVRLEFGSLCVHAAGDADRACGPLSAALTATAGAPSATPTPTTTVRPTSRPPESATPTLRATSTPPSPEPDPARFAVRLPIAFRHGGAGAAFAGIAPSAGVHR